MNLYKIIFRHHSEKDYEEGTKTYIAAENKAAVYDHIDTEYQHEEWHEKEKDTPNFRKTITDLNGEINDEYDLVDLYYGKTAYGWELITENLQAEQYHTLHKLGVIP